MQVQGLFLKPTAHRSSVARSHLQLLANQGIEGDRYAQPGSPRQLLILDQHTLTQFELQPGDLRENILLDQGLNHLQSGYGLEIGSTLIRITFRCEPCAYLNTLQPGLSRRIGVQRGWLGMVITGGTIAIGDPVRLTSAPKFPALPDHAKGRFAQFVGTIPQGQVVTTRSLIRALGVTSAHYRAIPGFIKRAPQGLPVHRIVASDGTLLSQHLPEQRDRLLAEGMTLVGDRVHPQHHWPPEQFHQTSSL